MADAGIGEAAAAEGAKGAGEAAAAGTAAEAGAAGAAGAGVGAGAAGALTAGEEAGLAFGAGDAAAAGTGAGIGGVGVAGGTGALTAGEEAALTAGTGDATTPAVAGAAGGAAAGTATGGGGSAPGGIDAGGAGTGFAAPAAADASIPAGIDVGGAGTGFAGSPSAGGTEFVPATDYSAYTGAQPTDVPNPVPDATGSPAAPDATTDPTITQRVLDAVKKNPLTAAGLGLNAVNGVMQMRNGSQLSKQLTSIGKPASDAANTLLAQYQSGQIPASTQFDINKWRDQSIAAARSRYAGMGDSSTLRNAISSIEAEAAAMTDKARQGLLTSGLQALGVGAGPLTAAAQASAAQDTNFANSQGSALNSLMLLQAMQAGKTPAATGG